MMKLETLKALKASIQHWEENVAAETLGDVKLGAYACALCDIFNIATRHTTCNGCPVMDATGKRLCDGSPYEAAVERFLSWDEEPEYDAARDAWRKAAQDELDFLRSLLPEEEE